MLHWNIPDFFKTWPITHGFLQLLDTAMKPSDMYVTNKQTNVQTNERKHELTNEQTRK